MLDIISLFPKPPIKIIVNGYATTMQKSANSSLFHRFYISLIIVRKTLLTLFFTKTSNTSKITNKSFLNRFSSDNLSKTS